MTYISIYPPLPLFSLPFGHKSSGLLFLSLRWEGREGAAYWTQEKYEGDDSSWLWAMGPLFLRQMAEVSGRVGGLAWAV